MRDFLSFSLSPYIWLVSRRKTMNELGLCTPGHHFFHRAWLSESMVVAISMSQQATEYTHAIRRQTWFLPHVFPTLILHRIPSVITPHLIFLFIWATQEQIDSQLGLLKREEHVVCRSPVFSFLISNLDRLKTYFLYSSRWPSSLYKHSGASWS